MKKSLVVALSAAKTTVVGAAAAALMVRSLMHGIAQSHIDDSPGIEKFYHLEKFAWSSLSQSKYILTNTIPAGFAEAFHMISSALSIIGA